MSGIQPTASTRYCSRCLTTFEEDQEHCPNLSCRRGRPQAGWGRMYGAGDVFDRHYKIHSLLALGGAGVTYLAREVGVDSEEIGPRLALKVLFASRDEGPYLKRLATEAQVLQELDHPNIVQYLGFVHRAGHSPYLVTRFEPGGSLLDHIKRVGSMPVRRTAQVARQICWALDKAHDMGVVHRDLKPENVLLARVVTGDEDAVVRVADFGIAKIQGALGSQTRVGAFVGTPQYAAPEQFIGGTPTPATDVYGVGALMYFCSVVMPVVRFADRLDPEDGYQMLVDALPPVVVRSHDDEDDVRRLNRVLEVCMDPDPTRRCTAEQLDGLLAAMLAGREPDIEAVRPTPTRSSPTLAAQEPDTVERLKALRSDPTTPLGPADASPAKPAEASPAKPAEPLPAKPAEVVPLKAEASLPRKSDDDSGLGAMGVLAGVAAGAAVGAAAGWLASRATDDDPPAADAGARANGAAPTPVRTAPVPPPDVAVVPSQEPPPPSPELVSPPPSTQEVPAPRVTAHDQPAPTPRRRGLMLPGLFLLMLLGGGGLVGGWAWLAWTSPRSLPDAVRLPPVTLDPANPADAAAIQQLQQALTARGAEIVDRCGVKSGKVTVQMVVEPGGQVRSAELKELSAGLDGRCAGEVLAADLPSPGWRPVRFAMALQL